MNGREEGHDGWMMEGRMDGWMEEGVCTCIRGSHSDIVFRGMITP